MPRNVSSSILPEALRADVIHPGARGNYVLASTFGIDEEPPVAGDAEVLSVEVA